MTQYEALELLLQAYLHEDMDDDYASVWDAVDDFAVSEGNEAQVIGGEITRLLATARSESELQEILRRQLGGNYRPQANGWTYRGWLEAVAVRVDEVLRSGGR
jgi:hypothetical protein